MSVQDVEGIQASQITGAQIGEMRALLEVNRLGSRRGLSGDGAARWRWSGVGGQIKRMAAEAPLLKLPEPDVVTHPRVQRAPVGKVPTGWNLSEVNRPESLVADLTALRPLEIQVVYPKALDYAFFGKYLAQYHYLSYRGPVGQNLGYLIRSCAGEDLACLLFGAAAWQCAARDRWIGWSAEQRGRNLQLIANNQRFLILPWVRVPQLTSHILWNITQRIDADWQDRYHHPLHMLESFVQPDRFSGACYQAANWIRVDQTTGRTRQSQRHRDNQVHAPVKDIYLYPLGSHACRHLCG